MQFAHVTQCKRNITCNPSLLRPAPHSRKQTFSDNDVRPSVCLSVSNVDAFSLLLANGADVARCNHLLEGAGLIVLIHRGNTLVEY